MSCTMTHGLWLHLRLLIIWSVSNKIDFDNNVDITPAICLNANYCCCDSFDNFVALTHCTCGWESCANWALSFTGQNTGVAGTVWFRFTANVSFVKNFDISVLKQVMITSNSQRTNFIANQLQSVGFGISGCFRSFELNVAALPDFTSPGRESHGRWMSINSSIHHTKSWLWVGSA